MRGRVGCVLTILVVVAASAPGAPAEAEGPAFTIERCWVDYDGDSVVNFVDIEIRYQAPVTRRQAQRDLMAVLHGEMYQWGLSLDYGELPLWSATYQDAAGVRHGLSMTVQPMLVEER